MRRKKCLKVEDKHVQIPELHTWHAPLYVLGKWAVTVLNKVDKNTQIVF